MAEIGLMDVLYDLLLRFIEKYDAKRGIPRPVSEPDLTDRQAAFRCFTTAVRFLCFVLCGIGSACLLAFSANLFDVESDMRYILACGGAVAVMLGGAKAMKSFLPYEREDPPVLKPPSAWAEGAWLKSAGLAQEYTGSRAPGELRLGTTPAGYQLVLPATQTMRHVALFGPRGSGKSSTFMCTFLRDWAKNGSTIVLDPKGELFEQTASRYRRVYQLNLIDPSRSDYWNFLPDCKRNARFAREVAELIVRFPRKGQQSGSAVSWLDTEIDTLTAILLHLPHIVEHPTPAMISEFISFRSIDASDGEGESPLTKEMNGSPDPQVAAYWKKFAQAQRSLQGTILVDLISRCREFNSSTVRAVTSSFAAAGSASRSPIDLTMLRQPGTAIYVSMLETGAHEYGTFLATFLRLALSVLSTPPPLGVEYAPGLFVLDEAGNIPVKGLTKMLDLALDSEVAMVLSFCGIDKIYQHYGYDGANSILHSIKTKVFLPGLDQRTIQVAARFAHCHTTAHRAVRRQRKPSRAEQRAEADLGSTYEQSLHKLVRHHDAIALVGTALPIKFRFPPSDWVRPQNRYIAANKGTPYVIDLQTAEGQSKGTSRAPGTPSPTADHLISSPSQNSNSLNYEVEGDQLDDSSKPGADDESPLEV